MVVVNRITIQPKAANAAYHTRGFLFVQKQSIQCFHHYLPFTFYSEEDAARPEKKPIQIYAYFIHFPWDILDGVSYPILFGCEFPKVRDRKGTERKRAI